MILSLGDEALEAALEIDDAVIAEDDGVDAIIITRLNRLKGLNCYKTEAFETFRRPSNMSIQAFVNEFVKRLFKTKPYGTVQSNDTLVHTLLKSANLSNHQEELIKATIPELQYDLMKGQLRKHSAMHLGMNQRKVKKPIRPRIRLQ